MFTRPLILIFMLVITIQAQAADKTILQVGSEHELKSLVEAIAKANHGDEIIISEGSYFESNIIIDKKLTLIGINYPIINGSGNGNIIRIIADSVTIKGLHFTATGISYTKDYGAIEVENASHILIDDNILMDTFFGVYLAETNHTIVSNNRIKASGDRESSSGNGIHLWSCRNIEVVNNHISGHRDGIYLEFAKNATIRQNISTGNLRYGLHYMFSDDSLYEFNTFDNNGAGVAVMYTKNVRMLNNVFQNNWGPAAYGLLLKDITDSDISGNTFRQNTVAIYSESSSRVNINRNQIEQNGWAVKIMANSQDNYFNENNFSENTFDVSTNSRRNFNQFNSNYWSRYDGYDLDGNGYGDVVYRPVRLFAIIVEQNPTALILLRGLFVDLLDVAEKIIPSLTPETLIDKNPVMKPIIL
jgi:nitrous oxidase accessory protein